jgi:glycosyltransferase involved in cell wall biosynthesis
VIGHPGWGETVFMRQVFPQARQVLYGEFYYHPVGVDTGVDPEFGPVPPAERLRIHAKNATAALAYTEADRIVAPTAFQGGLLPAVFRDRLRIIHEGVDTDRVRPAPPQRVVLPDGTALEPGAPLVTFVNRRFEPMRGFHTFMRALPALFERVPEARAVLIGADQAGGYGLPRARA